MNKKNQEVCDLVVDEAEAEIVRLIFHKYVYEGYGAQKLSHYLYEQGVVGRNNKNIPNTSIVAVFAVGGTVVCQIMLVPVVVSPHCSDDQE